MSKQHIPATRNIYSTPTHLQVRVVRFSAGSKTEYGACFNFNKLGGKAKAIAEAKALRDRLVMQHPPYGGIRTPKQMRSTWRIRKATKYETEFAKGTRLYIQRYMRQHGVSELVARRHFNSLMASIG